MTDQVLAEFEQGVQQDLLPVTMLNWLKRVKLRGSRERALFLQLCLRLGAGEASCLAIAIVRGYSFLTDDMKARRVARTEGVTISGSVGVLLELIRTHKLTLLVTVLIELGKFTTGGLVIGYFVSSRPISSFTAILGSVFALVCFALAVLISKEQ